MALKTKNTPAAQPVSETDTRLNMLNTLLTTPHRDLAKVYATHQEMIQADPLFYVRLAAWYNRTGEIRDHKEVFIISLCLSDFPGHRDVGLAMLREMPPYQVGRIVDFIHGKKVKEVTKTETGVGKSKKTTSTVKMVDFGLFKNVPRSVNTEVSRYLKERESDSEWFDATALIARKSLKRLYALLHVKPSERAQNILFNETPPDDSKLAAIKALRKTEDPTEQAKIIIDNNVPYRLASTVVSAMTPTVLLALIRVMSDQELINNLGSLKKRGAMDNVDLKKLISERLEGAKKGRRVAAMKTATANAAVDLGEDIKKQLEDVGDAQLKAKGRITRPTAIIIDKCVTGDTLLATDWGLIPISSLAPQLSFAGQEVPLKLNVAGRTTIEPAAVLYVNGKKSVRRVFTEKGYSIGASLNHPVMCYNEDNYCLQWREIGSIGAGDLLVLRKNTRCFGKDVDFCDYVPRVAYQPNETEINLPSNLTPGLARWIGYLIAEGRVKARPELIDFTNDDAEIMNDFCILTEDLFGVRPEVAPYNASRGNVVSISSAKLLHFLMGCFRITPSRSRDKVIPQCILLASSETQREYLRGYFAGDGGVMGRKSSMLAVSSASIEMLRQLQVMLLNLGIVSRVRQTKGRATNGKKISRNYARLTIGGLDKGKFLTEIGFSSARKQTEAIAATQFAGNNTWATRWSSVPVGNKVKSKHAAAGINALIDLARQSGINTDCLEEMKASDMFVDRVERVEAGEECVFDIHVPDSHSFVGNGIISHNSGSMNVAIEIGKRMASMISAIMDAPLYVYAADTMAYPIQAQGTDLASWEKAFMGIRASGGTSCGVGIQMLNRSKQRVEQIVMITDEGENQSPPFLGSLETYMKDQAVKPHIVFLKCGDGTVVETLETKCKNAGIEYDAYTFLGDYYALPALIQYLTKPSKVDLLMEIMSFELPQRRAA